MSDIDDILAEALRNPQAALLQMERLDCEESFYRFVQAAWHVRHPIGNMTLGWAIETVCRHLEAIHRGEITKLLVNIPPGCTKAALTDEPVMTTHGWKSHGDLLPGDFVFGPDGQPKRVEAVTPHEPGQG